MLHRQLAVCLWLRAEAFYHAGSVGALGEDVCPARWPITPLQTPLVLSNPPVVDNSTVRKRRRPLYLSFAVFIGLCRAFSVFPLGCFRRFRVKPKRTINDELHQSHTFTLPTLWCFILWVRWQHIKVCFTFWPRDAVWYAVVCRVRTKTSQRGTVGVWGGMLGEDVL